MEYCVTHGCHEPYGLVRVGDLLTGSLLATNADRRVLICGSVLGRIGEWHPRRRDLLSRLPPDRNGCPPTQTCAQGRCLRERLAPCYLRRRLLIHAVESERCRRSETRSDNESWFGSGTPFGDWGDPRSLSKFTRVVMGEYAGAPRTASSAIQLKQVWPYVRYAWNALANGMGLFYLAVVLGLCTFLCLRDSAHGAAAHRPTITVTPFIASFAAESSPGRYYILPIWGPWVAAALALSLADVYVASRRPLRNLMILSASYSSRSHHFKPATLRSTGRTRWLATDVRNVLNATPNGAILIAPWTYATPIAYGAYVSNVVGRRDPCSCKYQRRNCGYFTDGCRHIQFTRFQSIARPQDRSPPITSVILASAPTLNRISKLFRLQRLELSGKDVVAVRVRDMPTLCRAQGLARDILNTGFCPSA